MLMLLVERGLEIDDGLIMSCFTSQTIMSNNEIANLLFEHIKDVNYHDIDGDSFLMRACMAGNISLASKLLQKGADRDRARPAYGDYLYAACVYGYAEVVKLLLSWDMQGVRIPSESLKRALKSAAYDKHIDIVRLLVVYGIASESLNHALYWSAQRNQMNVTEYLLDNGTDVNASVRYYRTALSSACTQGSLSLVQLLLSRGADPNLTDGRGESPLEAALLYPEIVKSLLEAGADPNQLFASGSSALLELASSYHNRSLCLLRIVLLPYGADPNLAHTITGVTPLMIAAQAQCVGLVKLLLEHGADVTQVNSEGKSVLDILGQRRDDRYDEVIELCTSYIDSNKPFFGAKQVLK